MCCQQAQPIKGVLAMRNEHLSEVARAIGQPGAVRAVAHACGTNHIALVIPCHRVIREDGTLGGYKWGLDRKEAILAHEHAFSETGSGSRDAALAGV